MKNLIIVIAISFATLCSSAQGFKIKGNVEGLKNGSVSLATAQEPRQVISTANSENGKFVLSGTIPEPGLYQLELGSPKPAYIFLENKEITVSGKLTDQEHLKIEGSSAQHDFENFSSEFNPLIASVNNLGTRLQSEENEKKRAPLMAAYDSAVAGVNKAVDKFITSRKSSFVSPFVILVTAQLAETPAILESRFLQLDESVRNSQIGKSLAGYISYSKVGAVGTEAMDFTQPDTDGKPISLSSFKGKYVLVDFWASWCRPCRMENPNVVKAFNRFKGKNFTILSVSLDQKKEAWLKAIQSDGLKWTHVSDLKFWDNEVAVLYHIQSIPQNLLIDPQGKIVARDLRGEDLNKKLCELLGCN